LCTQQRTSSTSFKLLDAGQECLDLLHLSFRGRRIPRGQFLQFLEASNGAMSYLSEEELFRSLM
jgi:hypothetical protein